MTDTLPVRWLNVSHHSAAHIAARYPYAGYGSNLWLQQMAERCPQAEIIHRGRLRGARLAFSRVATIIADENVDTLVGVYQLSATDIEALDKKEGLGRVYDRYLVTPEVDGNAVRCFTYIKRDATPRAPSDEYFAKLTAGFRDWGFPDRRLRRARERATKDEAALPKPKPAQGNRWEPRGRDYEDASRPRRHAAPKSGNRTSLVTGRNLDREPLLKRTPNQEAVSRGMKIHWANRREAAKTAAEPRLFTHDESIGDYLARNEAKPSIAEQITREGGQTSFHNASTGEHWAKTDGVWKRVQQ